MKRKRGAFNKTKDRIWSVEEAGSRNVRQHNQRGLIH